MPHSGGGGSHSGGSHGGSHRSSHRSSRSGGGGSVRTSSKPFSGCRTFVVYRRDKPTKMIYSNSEYNKKMSLAELVFTCVFFGLFGMVPLFITVASIFLMVDFGRKPINPPVDKEIQIMDPYDLVSTAEEKELMISLERFYDTTGVVPAVEFTTDETWDYDYVSCESFAYNEYVTNFVDEKHVLIVYSYGYANEETGFNEFQWESMWGDEVGRAIRQRDEQAMTSIMQRNLTRANGNGVASAIGVSFDELNEQVSDTGIGFAEPGMVATGLGLFFMGTIFTTVIIFTIVSSIKKYKNVKKGRVHEVDKGMIQLNCEFCGCMYISGTISVCPHCGAPIPAYNFKTEKNG